MASLNDNLFTTLVNHSIQQEFGCYLHTPWGALKIGITSSGLVALVFEDGARAKTGDDSVFRAPFMQWLHAFQNRSLTEKWSQLAPQGTKFQQSVWRALLEIPLGQRVTYKEIATRIGQSKASRAVGSAIAANPIALLIPCHRVVPAVGGTGNYRWGAQRKLALLEAEQLERPDLHQLFQ
jgi:AraC family transcriptional regulator of adaptative response/methylated-DNA-[protein]-cysteine methyltransferase